MWGFLIAVVSGILMSVQGVLNTQVTKQTSLWVSSSFVQFTALLLCLLAWLFTDRSSFGTLGKVHPWYMLLGGVLGAFITITVIQSVGKLGPAKSAMLIVIAQLIFSYLIEVLGLLGTQKQPLEWRRVIGMAVSIVGIIIFKL
ncbi:MAG: DMT family transporter [Lachnospiraceae bacterium]|nr:DMT family transporter [Lachnospiraceae bacterium]